MRNSKLSAVPCLVLGLHLSLGVSAPAESGVGDLDARFGTHGQFVVPGQVDSAALIPLPDGRILIFGVPEELGPRDGEAIAIVRLLANGTPDEAFAPGGQRNLPLGTEPRPVPADALRLADGRILVAGYFAATDAPDDQSRSDVSGWVARISTDAVLDPTFGVNGVARVGQAGVDRILLLDDGDIVVGAPGVLTRLDANGTPAPFPGFGELVVSVGSSWYRMAALVSLQDGGLISSSGFSGPFDDWELRRVSTVGEVDKHWGTSIRGFQEVSTFLRERDGTQVLACGSGLGSDSEVIRVQRWREDGTVDSEFASSTGGEIQLGADTRPDFRYSWRSGRPRCRAVLSASLGDRVMVGDWSRVYEYGGGRILLARFNADGGLNRRFDPSGNGREILLGPPDQWSGWYVTDAETAPDGAVLLLARRSGSTAPGNKWIIDYGEPLAEQRTTIARVEMQTSPGAGSVGFNDVALRIAERHPGQLKVYRSGGSSGAISVRYEVLHGTTDSADIATAAGTLMWADGDDSVRTIQLDPIDDKLVEGEEVCRVRLVEPTGGASAASPGIDVTIEDDDALRELSFADFALRVQEGQSTLVTVIRPSATKGPVVVRYAVTPDLTADGSPKPRDESRLDGSVAVGELRWNADDVSSRTIRIQTFGNGGVQADDTNYFALADVSGTLRADGNWKVARITIFDDASLDSPPDPDPPPSSGGSGNGGGGGWTSPATLLVLSLLCLVGGARQKRG